MEILKQLHNENADSEEHLLKGKTKKRKTFDRIQNVIEIVFRLDWILTIR